ncbi:peptidoglycan-binding protein [Anaerobacillus sp. 1_MG-2023]|uniref:C40 family peptidase n=1 Tax=Anaerobacillus sp. 1_MG-2023 TaxID=3062655 RepID=UPI0026E3734D|nr:peptidoglycan-binding protein [Anaerobacillus sp. 1_MG-2023]MDO6658271.1 peptidoglycan-binding protein [Anaerobacillus sp. 1_MG-2023]
MQPSLVKKAITGSAFVAGVMFVQPDGVEAAFGDQELKQGMNNQDVKELQDVLKAKGYFTYHTSTGYYGPITKDAVSQFQQAVGLKVTGVATTDTLQKLAGTSKSQSSAASSSSTLQIGSRGQEVTDLQSKLKAAGYYSYNVDGIYGRITQKAVQDFQKEKGLSVTGKADSTTLNALANASSSSSKSSSSSSDISIGMRGSAVTDLQSKLKAKGYYTYNVDGIFGQITKKAVQDFQKAKGLSQTGVADSKTLSALSESGDGAKPTSGLTVGSRGSAVTNLQQLLKDRGYYSYNIDGIFGSITQKAVKEFQSIVGLQATGIADDKTIDALKSRSQQETSTVLKVGSTGSAVTDLQNKLKKAGTFHVEATGYFGPVTEKAVKDFQKAKKLQVTGTATKETMNALDGLTDKVESSPSTGEDYGDLLKKGSTGSLVKELQSKLQAIGLYRGPLDGDFGNGTEQAVRNFQSRNKLTVDGVVGPATWEKLKQSTGYEGNSNGDSGSGSGSSNFSVMDLIADASVYIGVPYVWGGNTPTQGFDCSGFLVYVFNKQGVSLPRTMAQMWNVTTAVSSPSVGDIVYFTTYKPGASHGGIYIGNNKFIHAGSSTGVTISDMTSSYWAPRYLGAKRAH